MKEWFRLNYDRHGEKDWCITTRAKSGRLRHQLTRDITVRVTVEGCINRHRQPKAVLHGIGEVYWSRDWTEIR